MITFIPCVVLMGKNDLLNELKKLVKTITSSEDSEENSPALAKSDLTKVMKIILLCTTIQQYVQRLLNHPVVFSRQDN